MKIVGRVLVVATLAFWVVLFASAVRKRPADPIFEGRTASAWCRDLLSADYTVRENARSALNILGERGVPQLRALLQRRDGPWEKAFLRLDGFLPIFSYEPLDAARCRVVASEMLGSLGAISRAAVPDLVAALAYDSSATESERALICVGESSIPALEQALRAKNELIRMRGARLLREFSSISEQTVSALISAIGDRDFSVRREVALSLGAVLEEDNKKAVADEATAALVALSRDDAAEVRAAAVHALGKVQRVSSQVIAALDSGLNDASPAVSLEAAKSLWELDEPANKVVPVLVSALETPERWRAAYALGEMGTNAAPAVTALGRLLAEERVPRPFRTPPSSAFALGRIGSAAVPEVVRLLGNPDASIQMNALMALSFMGKAGHAAVPKLLKLLADKNTEVRDTAALTLASVGAESSQIIGALSNCLRADDIYMRSAAAAHLREIAPEQNWLIPGE
jgi:HEAT repeat protein